jgi:hypothetical protein
MNGRSNRRRKFKLALCTLGLAVSSISCGPPDFERMSPTVWKPVADILLVDHPAHWRASDAEQAAGRAGVAAQVENVDGVRAGTFTSDLLHRGHPGMVVAVASAPPNADWLQVARAHPDVQFEWLGAAPGTDVVPDNVRVVVPDPQVVAAAEGYLAGRLAAQESTAPVIGWVADGTANVSRAALQQALAGLWKAVPAVVIVPVRTRTPQAGPWPRWVMVDRPLAADEYAVLHNHGCGVISLCPQSAAMAAVEPATPGVDALEADLEAFAGRHGHGGTILLKGDQVLAWSSAVPATVAGDVTGWLADFTASGTGSPGTLPNDVERAWAWVVARGR